MTTPNLSHPDGQTLTTELVDDILVVTIDKPGDSVNTLSTGLVGEFEGLFQRVDQDSLIKGVILISGKPTSFIAGADVEQFTEFRAPVDAERVRRIGRNC